MAALGAASGISKSEVSRICAGLDAEMAAFRSRPLGHVEFPYVWLDATYLKGRQRGQVVARPVVVATGVSGGGDREVLGLAVGDTERSCCAKPPAPRAGLRVMVELAERPYPTGIKVTAAELAAVPLRPHERHPEWNYTILPVLP